MKLGTKGRYAVMAMVELAQQARDHPATLAEIAAKQSLPLPYLEQLFAKLRKAGLIGSLRGQAGGYRLSKAPEAISIRSIIEAAGEILQATGCSSEEALSCHGKAERCVTHNLWAGLGYKMSEYLSTITLADVYEGRILPTGDVAPARATHAKTLEAGGAGGAEEAGGAEGAEGAEAYPLAAEQHLQSHNATYGGRA